MKKVFIFSLVLIGILSVAGCRKQDNRPKLLPEKLVIRVNSEKTVPHDTIVVFDANRATHNFITNEPLLEEAVYVAEKWSGEKPGYAISFPGQSKSVCTGEGSVTMHLTQNQEVSSELSKAPDSWASVGVVTSENGDYFLNLKEVRSFIQVIIDRDDVYEVRLKAVGGEMVAGSFEVDIPALLDGKDAFWKPVDGGEQFSEVRIRPSDDARSGDLFSKGYYNISILPGKYQKGLELKIMDRNGVPLYETVICPLLGLDIKRNETVMYNIFEDLYPDKVEINLDFYNDDDINPLGFEAPDSKDLDPVNGEKYTYDYHFQYQGKDMCNSIEFVVCKGTTAGATYMYYPMSDMVYGTQGKKVLSFTKTLWWIKLPAFPNRYLKAVTISHGNAYVKRVYIYTGPLTGSVCNYTANSGKASSESLYTERMVFPNNLQYAYVKETEKNTPYYLCSTSGGNNAANIRIYHLKLEYTKTLEEE